MVHNCCVPECPKAGYRIQDGRKVSFHKIPSQPSQKQLRLQWIHAIKRDPGKHFTISKHTKVCSLHFHEDDFIVDQFTINRKLRPNAVPSVFDFTPKIGKTRRPPPKRRLNFEQNKEYEGTSNVEQDEETPEDILRKENEELKTQIENIKKALSEAERNVEHVKTLQKELEQAKERAKNSLNFILNTFKNDDSSIEFYTGFTYKVCTIIYNLLDPGQNGENIELYSCKRTATTANEHEDHSYCDGPQPHKKGPAPALNYQEQFFLTLVRLRTGFSELHLAHLFGISTTTVSRYILTWVNFMFLKLGSLNMWLDRRTIDQTMPESFRKKFPTTRVIIDCTEIKTETPSTLVLNSEFFSQYKNACTVKGLVGIAPSGAVTFVSKLYTGSVSDRKITEDSGILSMNFSDNDVVMADKGFLIDDLLSEKVDAKHVRLNIPPFLERKGQFSEEEVLATHEIAAERIHVERAINQIKNFHIFDTPIPLNMTGSINQICSVCEILTNFQNPLLSDHPVCH